MRIYKEGDKIMGMENLSVETKLDAIVRTRKVAAKSFTSVLTRLLESGMPISEAQLADGWHEEMGNDQGIYPCGWYLPPPNGIGVLFGTEEDYKRMNYDSLRPEGNWPKRDIFLNRQTGIIYVYGSPVNRATGMIGDWGMTLYFGQNQAIKNHLKTCLDLNYRVLDYAQLEMTFADLTRKAYELFTERGLSNNVTSITDPAGVNIGHTVPGLYEDWTPKEIEIFQRNDWQEILTMMA